MKRIKFLYTGLIIGLMTGTIFSSCENWLNINDNSNYPKKVNVEALLPSACASTVAQLGLNGSLIGDMWLQHTTQGNSTNQYNTIVNYNISVNDFERLFINEYTNTLPDLKEIIEKSEAEKTWNFWLVAKVLTAYNYHMLTDLYEDIPFTEAGDMQKNPYPKYDDSKSVVYPGILQMLNDAIEKEADAKAHSNPTMGKLDMFLGGNIRSWVQFAKSLKLKVLMRDFPANKDEIKKLLDENDFYYNNCAMTCFEDAANKGNPLYEYNIRQLNTTQNIRACHTLCEYLITYNDPRIENIYQKITSASETDTDYSDLYEGLPCGTKPSTQDIPIKKSSLFKQAYNDPVYLMNKAEINFLVAEAYARLEDKVKAQQYYEAGVTASFNRWTASNGKATDFIKSGAPYAFDSSSEDSMLKCIMTQKWISYAAANSLDGVFDRNRTGIPSLSQIATVRVSNLPKQRTLTEGYVLGTLVSPGASTLQKTSYPRRLLIPNSSSQYNPNASKTKDLDAPMWWQVAKGK